MKTDRSRVELFRFVGYRSHLRIQSVLQSGIMCSLPAGVGRVTSVGRPEAKGMALVLVLGVVSGSARRWISNTMRNGSSAQGRTSRVPGRSGLSWEGRAVNSSSVRLAIVVPNRAVGTAHHGGPTAAIGRRDAAHQLSTLWTSTVTHRLSSS